jgi:peptidylprolyl isomerase
MLPRRLASSAAVAAALVAVAACGSSSSHSTATLNPQSTARDSNPTVAPGGDALAAITARGKPKVTVPSAPATKLEIHDDIVGTGATVKPHDQVTVHYVGVGQSSGKQFDASWDRGQPASFSLDQVIPGWGQGLVGMKVGGRRTLVIPGALAYGASPPTPDIKPNETLVFVVDLVSIG